jgi:hypothetical protein
MVRPAGRPAQPHTSIVFLDRFVKKTKPHLILKYVYYKMIFSNSLNGAHCTRHFNIVTQMTSNRKI